MVRSNEFARERLLEVRSTEHPSGELFVTGLPPDVRGPQILDFLEHRIQRGISDPHQTSETVGTSPPSTRSSLTPRSRESSHRSPGPQKRKKRQRSCGVGVARELQARRTSDKSVDRSLNLADWKVLAFSPRAQYGKTERWLTEMAIILSVYSESHPTETRGARPIAFGTRGSETARAAHGTRQCVVFRWFYIDNQ